MSPPTEVQATEPTSSTPAELAAEAALLEARRERLAIVRGQLRVAGDAYAEAQAATNERYQAAVGPLCAEVKELEVSIGRSEKAAAELEARRQRFEELQRQLDTARSELPG